MGLEDKRKKIDELDKEIVSLLTKRLEVATEIGFYKKEKGMKILDRSREEEVIKKNLGRVNNDTFAPYVETILEKLMSVSRDAQSDIVIENKTPISAIINMPVITKRVVNPVVAYGGIKGSYGEQALIQSFGEVKELSFKNFSEVVDAVISGEADYGILPIENTSTGGILEVERLLERDNVYIVGETVVHVAHCLLGLGEIGDIKTVYSHVQGFEQSREFLRDYSFEEVPYFNTAISAEFVAKSGDKTLGAIASKRAGEVYGLKILKEDINYNLENYTRFVIIKNTMELEEDYDKISLQVVVEDREGSLLRVIKSITEHRLNMVKIASRPILGKPFEYIFSIDINGNINEKRVKKTLKEISENSVLMNFKGNYKEVKGK
ncbi:MAG: chorismate mutase [Firmicutes bacterium]|nr:chorismate mutase [Bacillota bacterium]